MNSTNLGPLAFPCPHCSVAVGVKCRNYQGRGKQPCPDRGKPEAPAAKPAEPKAAQPSLFDEEML